MKLLFYHQLFNMLEVIHVSILGLSAYFCWHAFWAFWHAFWGSWALPGIKFIKAAFPETKTKSQYKLWHLCFQNVTNPVIFATQSEHRYWGWSPNEASWATFPETKLASNHHWRKAAGGLWSWAHISPWMFNPFVQLILVMSISERNTETPHWSWWRRSEHWKGASQWQVSAHKEVDDRRVHFLIVLEFVFSPLIWCPQTNHDRKKSN